MTKKISILKSHWLKKQSSVCIERLKQKVNEDMMRVRKVLSFVGVADLQKFIH